MGENLTHPSETSMLSTQWSNPGSILSLLLIVGGNVVQKAIAQLTGVTSPPFLGGRRLCFTPVAFSFGWVSFAFSALQSAVGSQRLMPESLDWPSLLINCSNAYTRENRSWVLGRMLRDHELRNEVDPVKVSLRVDIFELKKTGRPHLDRMWWSGVWTILVQIFGFGFVGWVKWNDWGPMLIALGGTVLALLTTSIPQWQDEKWAGRLLRKQKIVALTRGNGSHHVMVFRCEEGTWDLEALAAGATKIRRETRYLIFALATLWTCLLVAVAGMKSHTWLLVGMGGLGMVQNVYAAGAQRSAESQDIQYEPVKSGIIVGDRAAVAGDGYGSPDSRLVIKTVETVTGGVMEVLIELENRQETAGLALLNVFFPGGLSVNNSIFRNSEAGRREKLVVDELHRRLLNSNGKGGVGVDHDSDVGRPTESAKGEAQVAGANRHPELGRPIESLDGKNSFDTQKFCANTQKVTHFNPVTAK